MTYTVFDNKVTTFSVAGKCPECGQEKLFGYNFKNQDDKFMHTHYVCTFWRVPEDTRDYLRIDYVPSKDRCGWHGWSVPGWDD